MESKSSATKAEQSNAEEKLIENKDKWSILKFAKQYRHSKRLAKYTGATVLVAGGTALALPFLGVVMLFGMALGAIAFMATIAMTIKHVKSSESAQGVLSAFSRAASSVSEKTPVSSSEAESAKASADKHVILWDMNGTVCVFGIEPTIQELLLANNKNKNIPGLLRVPNNQKASILMSDSKDAVKIKLLGGDNDGHVGWVGKANTIDKMKQAV
jgi:hypothetical protein